jgi:signal transduction histidine kinase
VGDVNEVVRGSLHVLRRQIGEHRIAVDAAYAEDLPPHAFDAAQIEQVCLALITNAIEAMPTGGTLRVRTALASGGDDDGDALVLTLGDTGHGIAAEQLPHIFRLFYTRKARGTGVGLATVKRIVDGHHGRIAVASTPGEGTEFTITLPLHPERGAAPAAPLGDDVGADVDRQPSRARGR